LMDIDRAFVTTTPLMLTDAAIFSPA
jgi:hypothetical protein